jgi:hypothetical protein
MAASLIGSVPVALLYSFFMDYFVSGLTAGAPKGRGFVIVKVETIRKGGVSCNILYPK